MDSGPGCESRILCACVCVCVLPGQDLNCLQVGVQGEFWAVEHLRHVHIASSDVCRQTSALLDPVRYSAAWKKNTHDYL